MEPDQWAQKFRVHPKTTGQPGPRDPYLTPYIVEPERQIAKGASRRVILVMGAQSGKTELMLDVVGHRLDQRPAPCLYVGPNKQFLSEQFEPRVMGLLDGASVLTQKVERGKRMTKTRKMVGGVPFRLAHAGSSTALKSDPAALALVDEYDEMKADVNNQGGPLGLVERRGDTYADFVCVVTSTPKRGKAEPVKDERSGLYFWEVAVPEEIDSPIWAIWQQGTRHHWSWPCPHCNEYFVPRFNLLRWPEKAGPLEASQKAFIECPRCGGVIEEQHKAGMNERGRYVAPGQHVDGEGYVRGEPRAAKALSYWVSGLASPFVTIGERVAVYVEAVMSGDPAEIQQAVNGGFGELYLPGGGQVPEWAEIKEKAKRSDYKRGTVPEEVLFLALSADIQRQSIPWTIRGWGPRATSWLVDWGYIRGDTAEEEVWHRLAELVSTPIEGVPIKVAFIDSGFRPGKPDTLPLNRIYEFCRRFGRRTWPTKGSSSPMRVPLIFSKLELNRKGKSAKYGIEIVRLDTDHWKQWVHERLRWPEDRPGAWAVPKELDDDYCKQIVAEARLVGPNGKPEWVQRSRDNHFLDCEAMQAAAGHLLNVQRIPFSKPWPPEGTKSDGPLPNPKTGPIGGEGRKPETRDEVETPEPKPLPTAAVVKPTRPPMAKRRRVIRSNYLGA